MTYGLSSAGFIGWSGTTISRGTISGHLSPPSPIAGMAASPTFRAAAMLLIRYGGIDASLVVGFRCSARTNASRATWYTSSSPAYGGIAAICSSSRADAQTSSSAYAVCVFVKLIGADGNLRSRLATHDPYAAL